MSWSCTWTAPTETSRCTTVALRHCVVVRAKVARCMQASWRRQSERGRHMPVLHSRLARTLRRLQQLVRELAAGGLHRRRLYHHLCRCLPHQPLGDEHVSAPANLLNGRNLRKSVLAHRRRTSMWRTWYKVVVHAGFTDFSHSAKVASRTWLVRGDFRAMTISTCDLSSN